MSELVRIESDGTKVVRKNNRIYRIAPAQGPVGKYAPFHSRVDMLRGRKDVRKTDWYASAVRETRKNPMLQVTLKRGRKTKTIRVNPNSGRADVYVGWIDIWSADHANVKVVLWRRSGTAEDRKLAREYARKEFGKNGQVFLSKNTTDARTAKQRIAAKLASRARRMYPGKSISGDFLPRTNPKRRNPDISGRETKEEYGQRRANETGRKYFMTGMGHVLLDVPGNRGNKKRQDDMGGIVRVFKPKRRRNPRGVKTKIEYVIQGNYGYGWDDENYEDNKIDAKRSLREYRANGPGTYRLIRRRVKKES